MFFFFGARLGLATIGSFSLIPTVVDGDNEEGIPGTGEEDSILSTVGAIAPTVTGSAGCTGSVAGATGSTGAGAVSTGAGAAAGCSATGC